MNCLVIDDEPLAREGLVNYVNQIETLTLAGQAADPVEALAILEKNKVDLLLLDIQMPKMTGLDFLRTLTAPPLVILTTAYPSFALEGYQLDVLDYLVKPITFPRFLKSVMKAKKQYDLLNPPQSISEKNTPGNSNSHIFIKTDGRIERIEFGEIYVVESMQNYVAFHTVRGKFLSLTPLKSTIDNLPSERFIQVHRSFVVNKEKVRTIDGNVIVIDKHRIPISRNRFEEVMEKLVKDRLL